MNLYRFEIENSQDKANIGVEWCVAQTMAAAVIQVTEGLDYDEQIIRVDQHNDDFEFVWVAGDGDDE